MEGSGARGRRLGAGSGSVRARLSRLLAVATLSTSGIAVMDVPHLAPGDGPYEPPIVEGGSLQAALEELAAWASDWWPDPNQQPGIEISPTPEGVDPGLVHVLHQEVNAFDDVAPPDNRLSVGVQVPNFVGLSLDAALEASSARALELFADDPNAGGDWIVVGQGPGPGELVEFGTGVEVAARAPVPPLTPAPPPPVGPTPEPPSPAPTANPNPAAGPVDDGTLFLIGGLLALLLAAAGITWWATRLRPRAPGLDGTSPDDEARWSARIRVELHAGPPPASGIEELPR